MKAPRTDFDTPWKEILGAHFPEFLEYFFPAIAADIDWSKGFEDEIWGCKVLFEFPMVKLLDHGERWAELETSRNPFAMVVMAHLKALETRADVDNRKVWKARLMRDMLRRGVERQEIVDMLRFIDWVMKLPDDLQNEVWNEVLESEEATGKMEYITSWERTVIQRGREQGLREGRQEGLQEGRQEGIQEGFQHGVQEGIQQGVQQGVQIGLEQGEREGVLSGIELGLELRFGEEGLRAMPEVRGIKDVIVLRLLQRALRTAGSLEAWRQIYLSAALRVPPEQ